MSGTVIMPTDPKADVERHSDTLLIEVLKGRGYAVIKRDRIVTLGGTVSISKDELLDRSGEMGFHVRMQLATSVARHLAKHPAFPVRELQRGIVNIEYATELTFLVEPITPDNPGFPYWLQNEEFMRR